MLFIQAEQTTFYYLAGSLDASMPNSNLPSPSLEANPEFLFSKGKTSQRIPFIPILLRCAFSGPLDARPFHAAWPLHLDIGFSLCAVSEMWPAESAPTASAWFCCSASWIHFHIRRNRATIICRPAGGRAFVIYVDAHFAPREPAGGLPYFVRAPLGLGTAFSSLFVLVLYCIVSLCCRLRKIICTRHSKPGVALAAIFSCWCMAFVGAMYLNTLSDPLLGKSARTEAGATKF